jgi:hypothetical protein
VVSWNWTLRPNLINELRFGLALDSQTLRLPFDGTRFTNALGLEGAGPTFPFNGLPWVNITGYQPLDTWRGNSVYGSHTHQWNNNTTWTVGRHTMKFGFDVRRLRGVSPLSFLLGNNHGYYNFISPVPSAAIRSPIFCSAFRMTQPSTT